MKFEHMSFVSRAVSGRQGKTSKDKIAVQRPIRRKFWGVLLFLLLFYAIFKYQTGMNKLPYTESSKGAEKKKVIGPWLRANQPSGDTKRVHFDFTKSDEEFLISLSRFGAKLESCTDETKTCVATLMMVNRGAIDLYQNFLHYLAKLDLRKYDFIVCTSDEEVASLALLNNQRVIMVNHNEILSDRLDFGTPSYQMAMSLRTRIINVLLKARMYEYWLIADIDSVWLCNPFEIIFDADFSSDPFDVGGQVDFNRICGGFLLLKTSSAVQKLWNDVTSIYEDTIKRYDIGKDIEKTEQGILHDLISDESRRLHIKEFSKEVFPSGFDYFEDGFQENACVVHNNYIIGIEQKIDRFKEYNLWMDDE